MPRRRVSVRKLEEVLRLRAAGHSISQIAQSVRLGQTTVQEYLVRARAAGVDWPLPEEMDAEGLEAKLFPASVGVPVRPVPDWLAVHRELKKPGHVTLKLLWLEWREEHPDGWGITQFCTHYRKWLSVQDPVMRTEYKAGERLFVDYAGDTVPVVDPQTGEIRQAQIFVATLGASGLVYVEASWDQTLSSWLMAHRRAFEFYGGSVAVLTPDNLKSGVTRACWYDPDINPSYSHLASHFNAIVLPTRTAAPRDKAAVESEVLVAERWILAPLRRRTFFSLGELNQALAVQREEVNTRHFRGLPTSRRELFEGFEREALRPLPSTPYEFAELKMVTVGIDYHVAFDHRFYSVPFQLIKQRLELRATGTTVEIFRGHGRVASHLREHGQRRYITDPEHRPASHRAHLEWTPERLLAWAGSIGEPVAEVASHIFETRPHPEHGYRAVLGLTRLAGRYGNERVAAACARALVKKTVSYTSISSILKNNLDRQPLPAVQLTLVPPVHENLRGADYYRSEQEA